MTVVNVFISKFTVKKEVDWNKSKLYIWRIFLITKFICKSSVMRALKIKLVFPAEHFPNLGKIIIYQELFYIFEGNYEGYFKFPEKFKERKETK